MPHYRLAFLLQQSHRDLYQMIAQKIREAPRQRRDEEVQPVIEFADRLEPEHIAARLKRRRKISASTWRPREGGA